MFNKSKKKCKRENVNTNKINNVKKDNLKDSTKENKSYKAKNVTIKIFYNMINN